MLTLGTALAVLVSAGCRWWWYPATTQAAGWWLEEYPDPAMTGPPSPSRLVGPEFTAGVAPLVLPRENMGLKLCGILWVTWPGPYRLALGGDDGVRLQVDGYQVLNDWGQHAYREREARVWLGTGPHLLEMAYQQMGGEARLRLALAPPLGGFRALTAHDLPTPARAFTGAEATARADRYLLAMVPWLGLALGLCLLVAIRLWWPGWTLWPWLAVASAVMLFMLWANSGTLAPFGALMDRPVLYTPGQYPLTIDHDHHMASYWMLEGQPVENWRFSYVLRRLAFPVYAFPFRKAWEVLVLSGKRWGFMEGGLPAAWLLQLLGLASWACFLDRRLGRRAALWGMALLATYPGLCYWGGIPWDYQMLVPGSLWGFMILCRLERPAGWGATLGLCLLMGCLFLGYELWMHFIPAALVILVWRGRSPLQAGAGLVAMLAPVGLVIGLLTLMGGYGGTQIAGHEPINVLRGWLHTPDWAAWGAQLRMVPYHLVSIYLASNYFALPMLFLIYLVWRWRRGGVGLEPAEAALLLAALAVFLVTHLAPPYSQGWNRRTDFYARFYQPIFVALMYYCARFAAQYDGRGWRRALAGGLCGLVILGNAYVCVGGLAGWPGVGWMHWRFGREGQSYQANIERLGRRPFGVMPPLPAEFRP